MTNQPTQNNSSGQPSPVKPGVPLEITEAVAIITEGGSYKRIPPPPQMGYGDDYAGEDYARRAALTAAAARRVAGTSGFPPVFQGLLGLIAGAVGGGVVGASAATGFEVSGEYWIWAAVFGGALLLYWALARWHSNRVAPIERYAELWDQAAVRAEGEGGVEIE